MNKYSQTYFTEITKNCAFDKSAGLGSAVSFLSKLYRGSQRFPKGSPILQGAAKSNAEQLTKLSPSVSDSILQRAGQSTGKSLNTPTTYYSDWLRSKVPSSQVALDVPGKNVFRPSAQYLLKTIQ
jgi:hypothetical protein